MDPIDSHAFFHQNAKFLAKHFMIPLIQAQHIVQTCNHCASLHHYPELGVNPRGLQSNQIWQMDVTLYPPFSPWKYLHVTIDTYSHYIWATPQRGEQAKHVINHVLAAAAIMGRP